MLSLDFLSAGTALLPVVSDGLRGVFARLTGGAGAEPQNIDERVRVMEADTARLRALASMDGAGETYKWVNGFRAMVRPVTALLLVSTYAGVSAFAGTVDPNLANFAVMAAFSMFGERSMQHARRS